jgi:cysteine-rich repeat protein
MTRRFVLGFAAALALPLALSGCGDSDPPRAVPGAAGEGGEAGDGAEGGAGSEGASGGADAGSAGTDSGSSGAGGRASGCEPIALGRPVIYVNVLGEVGGLRYPVESAIGKRDLPEYLLVELFDSTTPAGDDFLPPLRRGEFSLTRSPNDTLPTCQHCVSLVADVTEGVDEFGLAIFQPKAWYFQRSGALVLEEVHDPLNAALENTAFLGKVSDVDLVPVDFEDPAAPFIDGDCFYLADAAFDTRPTPGDACEDLDDCGNELLEICDPSTLRCVDESQCNIDQPCEGDAFCIQQSPRSALGACYAACEPFAARSCPDGRTCVQYGLSERDGYCLTSGDVELGDTCDVKDAVTSCAGTAVCLDTCVAQCAYFSGEPECPDGAACDVLGHCLAPAAGDSADFGEPCRGDAELATPCARSGRRFAGFCFGYDPEQRYVCQRSCFVDEDDYDGDDDDGADDADCEAAEFCALRFSSGLGVCLPDPICGDGLLGEVGEVCDDGNTASDDGCSADCQTVEFDRLCEAPLVLAADDEVSGTTQGGLDGFKSSCQAGLARGQIYTITPPGPGQLKLRLLSSTRQLVAIRTNCANTDSELGCGESFAEEEEGDASLLLQITTQNPAAVTLVVTAATVIDEGPFSLEASFTPQECGDSSTVGSEVCDDGNEVSNDGCSADCSTIEYDYWCENAETLALDRTVAGNIAGSPFLFEPSCGYGAGADKLYRLTAPRDGTLHVRLNQEVDGNFTDLSLLVLGDCGAPSVATELACSAVLYPNEDASVEVTEGQNVVLVVDGLFATSAEFEIRATLD